jgi:hypothetical protein
VSGEWVRGTLEVLQDPSFSPGTLVLVQPCGSPPRAPIRWGVPEVRFRKSRVLPVSVCRSRGAPLWLGHRCFLGCGRLPSALVAIAIAIGLPRVMAMQRMKQRRISSPHSAPSTQAGRLLTPCSGHVLALSQWDDEPASSRPLPFLPAFCHCSFPVPGSPKSLLSNGCPATVHALPPHPNGHAMHLNAARPPGDSAMPNALHSWLLPVPVLFRRAHGLRCPRLAHWADPCT